MSGECILEPWDEDDGAEFDGCEHGVGFDEECEDCEDDPIGCVFPGRCVMPGVHLESECHTAEMMEDAAPETVLDSSHNQS
jgi:hypothetical protein